MGHRSNKFQASQGFDVDEEGNVVDRSINVSFEQEEVAPLQTSRVYRQGPFWEVEWFDGKQYRYGTWEHEPTADEIEIWKMKFAL